MHSRLPAALPGPVRRRAIAAAIVALGMVVAVLAQPSVLRAQQVDLPRTSDGAASVEALELRALLEATQKQLAAEQAKTAEAEHQRQLLAQSLAAANAEAESHRAAYRDLLIKLEGLGVDLLDPDSQGLQSRLLKAVRDRDLLERELEAVTNQFFKLTEAFVSYMQTATSDDAEARQRIEEELLATETVFRDLGDPEFGARPARAIAEGQVVSLDREIGLLVVNVGKHSGIRVGMPIEVLRVDRPIGNALVVDVRDSICGAVISDLVAREDDVKVGDRIRPRPGDL